MDDEKIDKLIKELISECKKRNYKSVVLVGNEDSQLIRVGTSAKYFELVCLVAYLFRHLEQETDISSVCTGINLALLAAATVVKPNEFHGDLSIFDAETLKKMAAVIKNFTDEIVDDMTNKTSDKINNVSPILQ